MKAPKTLHEAQEQNKLKQFAKEHPSQGDEDQFDQLLQTMAKPAEKPE